jgi:hypothetical protein
VSIWEILFWVLVVAIVYMLVRPGSTAGPALITLLDAFAAILAAATGASTASSSSGKGNG